MWITGQSGRQYLFHEEPPFLGLFSLPGLYIFAKPQLRLIGSLLGPQWDLLYVGETGNLRERVTKNHEKWDRARALGMTTVLYRLSSEDATERKWEENDIRAKHLPPLNSPWAFLFESSSTLNRR